MKTLTRTRNAKKGVVSRTLTNLPRTSMSLKKAVPKIKPMSGMKMLKMGMMGRKLKKY